MDHRGFTEEIGGFGPDQVTHLPDGTPGLEHVCQLAHVRGQTRIGHHVSGAVKHSPMKNSVTPIMVI